MTVGDRVGGTIDDAFWRLSRWLRPVVHPRRWWIERDLARARADYQRRYETYLSGLPRFDHPPAGLDPRVIARGGTISFDTTQAVPGRYRFPVPGFAEPMDFTIVGEDCP